MSSRKWAMVSGPFGVRRAQPDGGTWRWATLNPVEDLLTIVMLVITRDLVETPGVDEAVLIKWVSLEMDKVSIIVECPR
jgi:hypothetical protein